LGITPDPGQKIDFLEPFFTGIGKGWQSSLGLDESVGISIQVFVTQAATRSDFSADARVLNISAPFVNISIAENAGGQMTVSIGPSLGVGFGVSVYNTYTSVSEGGMSWISDLVNGIQRLNGVISLQGQ
jgi:hypothetical protein